MTMRDAKALNIVNEAVVLNMAEKNSDEYCNWRAVRCVRKHLLCFCSYVKKKREHLIPFAAFYIDLEN